MFLLVLASIVFDSAHYSQARLYAMAEQPSMQCAFVANPKDENKPLITWCMKKSDQ
jgi:hypothetical protein